ncbi:MAG: hypothetical protein JSW71_20595 [Gemmatimonadota bacterium]|nr:MAG: hypothetical protein JSW71_20595 [Gemmatimonadota bacterium]
MSSSVSKTAFVSGIICIVLAVVVFVLADGLRRWYSGIFFAIIGLVVLLNALRWQRVAGE